MKPISKDLETAINERKSIREKGESSKYCKITENDEKYEYEIICPIISEGDAIGAVIMLSKESKSEFGTAEEKLAASAAGFLGRQMEQ